MPGRAEGGVVRPLRFGHVTSADDRRRLAHELPIDPDVDVDEDARHHRAARPPVQPTSTWPRFRLSVVAAVFAGGCIGGLVRYAVTHDWPTPDDHFPWPTFGVNVAGAFVLAVLIVVVSDVFRGSTYLRPLLGTGFCGALTTFSTFSYETVRLAEAGRWRAAAGNVVISLVLGLVAVAVGWELGTL
jgi:CrcB protein